MIIGNQNEVVYWIGYNNEQTIYKVGYLEEGVYEDIQFDNVETFHNVEDRDRKAGEIGLKIKY